MGCPPRLKSIVNLLVVNLTGVALRLLTLAKSATQTLEDRSVHIPAAGWSPCFSYSSAHIIIIIIIIIIIAVVVVFVVVVTVVIMAVDSISKYCRVTVKAMCPMNLVNYPMDTQTCSIVLLSCK